MPTRGLTPNTWIGPWPTSPASSEPAAAVSSPEQLDERLDTIASSLSTDARTIVEVCAHQQVLTLGLGLPEAFVQINSASGMPPYLVTVGDRDPPRSTLWANITRKFRTTTSLARPWHAR